MRIRTIKPDFWRSATLAGLSRDARLCFIGLWNYADDEGRGLLEPRLLKGDLFPLDDAATPADIERWIAELAAAQLIIVYTSANGRRIFAVRSWKEHQRIDRPQVSKLPEPIADNSTNIPRTIVEPSLLEGKGREEERKGTGKGKSLVEVNGNGHRPRLKSFDQIQARLASVLAEVADGTRARLTADELRDTQADLIFAYWQAKLDHKDALLDTKRLARLRSRLIENGGNVHELLYVIDGALKDRNLMGQNEHNRKYDGVETIFRDRGQVERLAKLGGFVPGKPHPMAEKYLGATT